jgi:hypothetical protein
VQPEPSGNEACFVRQELRPNVAGLLGREPSGNEARSAGQEPSCSAAGPVM